PTLGPSLGGYITQSFSWHWLFLINIVPGILVAFSVWKLVDIDKPDFSLLKKIDFIGIILLALSLGSLQYVLEEGSRNDWFSDHHIISFSIISGVSGILFGIRAFTHKDPVVDFAAFKTANFSMGSSYSFILGIGLYGAVYLMPLYLGVIRGYNSLQIGAIMFVTGAFQFLSAPIAGIASKYVDLRVMLFVGLILFGMGAYLNSFMTADYSFDELFLPQALRGVALMFCFIPINQLSLGTLPKEQLKNASGLYNLMRNLGGAMGLSILNTMASTRTSFHYNRLGESVTASRQAILDAYAGFLEKFTNLATGSQELSALNMISRLTEKQSILMAYNDCFYVISLIFFTSALFVPFLNKPSFSVSDAH
ncbi:MAG: DHA2 family efflux MFS transporter permease subunit, partial [Alphaproteobacteria bacterium]|nr:DHA2 family efflux MFS transporter permease subunit [Alphaproteobacteria bacterium]